MDCRTSVLVLAMVALINLPDPARSKLNNPPTAQESDYLSASDIQAIEDSAPNAPDRGTPANPLDRDLYFETRAVLRTSRGLTAAQDDIYDVDQIVPTFSAAFGVRLSRQQQPELFAFLDQLLDTGVSGKAAAYQILNDLKSDPTNERKRPMKVFAADPDTCISRVDMAGYGQSDNSYKPALEDTNSFPSGHTFRGMMIALVLAEIHPEHAAELINRGVEFGESRVICGFHWESDTTASRIVALEIMARMKLKPTFTAEIAKIRSEHASPYVECKCSAPPAAPVKAKKQ